MLKMSFNTIVFFICSLVFCSISGRSLPSFIKACRRNDANINNCIKNMLETLRPYAVNGIPEMHVPPLDPISIPLITLNQGTNSVNFKAVFTNLKGYGGKDFQTKNVRINLKENTFDVDLFFPNFQIDSKYEINGKILMLPIKGNGLFVGNFSNIDTSLRIVLKTEKRKNGKLHYDFKEKNINLNIGNAKINFSNLFNGNKEMSNNVNRFINENWRSLLQETKPLFEDTVLAMFVNIYKPVFDMYSIDELFPV
ncbi:circadian clock-controlled protein daywake-like [Daktulosphaira vitifoliae]|uniref:circadian clock-controlled protein daywake-like n=1 Tax=Daktulosphaira vitifoliae TaxID=58002 RepID=UPI0021AA240E|nr:circadian clock-controlled protein daywake-like [Daktulosphaira vitifoliae]